MKHNQVNLRRFSPAVESHTRSSPFIDATIVH